MGSKKVDKEKGDGGMKRLGLAGMLLTFLLWVGCAGVHPKLEDPKGEQSVLLIGSVIADVFEYHHITDTFKYATDVAIVGQVEQNGRLKTKLYWTKTDEHGYFYLANLPPGAYGIQGFRVKVIGSEDMITVVNDLQDSTEYFHTVRRPIIKKRATYFPYKPKNRVVDFGHNYFLIDRGQEVHYKHFYRIKDLRLVTGDLLNEPPVAYYFFNTYPNSGWRNLLPVRR